MNIHQQKTNLKQEVEQLVTEGEKIQQLYQQRDELLGLIKQIKNSWFVLLNIRIHLRFNI